MPVFDQREYIIYLFIVSYCSLLYSTKQPLSYIYVTEIVIEMYSNNNESFFAM